MKKFVTFVLVLVALAAVPDTAAAQEPAPVFEVSNPICRTLNLRSGSFVQVQFHARLLDYEPRGHVTAVVHLWYTDADDSRRYLSSVRNELFVADLTLPGAEPVVANNPDLDIQPGEIAGFYQDKFFIWSDVDQVRCGRLALYHQGRKLPVDINTDWRIGQ